MPRVDLPEKQATASPLGTRQEPWYTPLMTTVDDSPRIRRLLIRLCLGTMPLMTIGCAGEARFVRTAPDPRPLVVRAPGQVAVWPAATVAGRPVVQTGIIEGESSAAPPFMGDRSQEPMIEIMKEAGLRGCDAVVPSPVEQRLYASSSGTPLFKLYQTAACFVYAPGGQHR